MAQFSVNPHRRDPYRNFKFRVRWDNAVIPGVCKVSALRRTTEVVAYREGDEPSTAPLSPGTTSFDQVVLERGVTHDTAFEEWANQVFSVQGDSSMSLQDYRKEVMVDLINLQGQTVKSYHLHRCWVSEYQALPDLDANEHEVAIERLVLQVEGWERDEAVPEPAES